LYERRRNLVVQRDGRTVNVARFRGQLFVCATGCCCGRTDDGFAPVPTELYHSEWERRRLRNLVHLTVGGCLGPCALANVVLLLFDGHALWFHSINADALVLDLYDYIEQLLEAGAGVALPVSLRACQFTASVWQQRPDGQAVDDHRPRRRSAERAVPSIALPAATGRDEETVEAHLSSLLTDLGLAAAVPRRNGELVFDAPWQGRVFAMAVTLSEQGVFPWEEFRAALIREIAAAEARGGEFRYYHAWLAAFEGVLAARGVLSVADLEEAAFQFEFGERDDVSRSAPSWISA
jgi:nitrile hydratase accessory protein